MGAGTACRGSASPCTATSSACSASFTGYDDAAILVASVSGLVMLASAAVLARVLAGPAAGGLAAVTLAAVPLVANATHWGNGYPLLAATTGAALAGSALLAAHPSRRTLALAAATTIAALASEDRGRLVEPWVLGMTASCAPRRPRVAWFLLAAVPATTVPPAIDYGLGHRAPFAPSATDSASPRKTWCTAGCGSSPTPTSWPLVRPSGSKKRLSSPSSRPCAAAVLHYNSATIAPKATFYSGFALLLGLCGWLVSPRPRRQLVQLGVVTGGAAWLVFATATPMPHRYILQFVVPLVVVVPVAIGRLGALAGPGWRGWGVSTAVCLGVGSGDGWLTP